MAFRPCATKHCVTVYIEDELRVTRTQTVDITLSSDDDRIALQQTTGYMEIKRIPGMCDNLVGEDLILRNVVIKLFTLSIIFCVCAI